jgi:hypothetical protein
VSELGRESASALWPKERMSPGSYDPDTLDTLRAVFGAAWADLETALLASLSSANAARTKIAMTKNLLYAADNGVCDPERLKSIALQGIVTVSLPPRVSNGVSAGGMPAIDNWEITV